MYTHLIFGDFVGPPRSGTTGTKASNADLSVVVGCINAERPERNAATHTAEPLGESVMVAPYPALKRKVRQKKCSEPIVTIDLGTATSTIKVKQELVSAMKSKKATPEKRISVQSLQYLQTLEDSPQSPPRSRSPEHGSSPSSPPPQEQSPKTTVHTVEDILKNVNPGDPSPSKSPPKDPRTYGPGPVHTGDVTSSLTISTPVDPLTYEPTAGSSDLSHSPTIVISPNGGPHGPNTSASARDEYQLTMDEISLDIQRRNRPSYPRLLVEDRTPYEQKDLDLHQFVLFINHIEGKLCVGRVCGPTKGRKIKLKLYLQRFNNTLKMMQSPSFVDEGSLVETQECQSRFLYAKIMEHNFVSGEMEHGRRTYVLIGRALKLFRKFYNEVFAKEYPTWPAYDP